MGQRENDGAVTYKDLSLSVRNVISIRRIEITQEPGDHARMYVEAVLDSDMEENDFHEIEEQVFLVYEREEGANILFYGIIDQIRMEREGADRLLYLNARDATRQMDIERRSRAFQNPQMTVSQLVEEVMAAYPDADYKIHVADEPIGQLVIQYEETDWEFLKRFFSKYHVQLYPDTSYPVVRFQAGLSPAPEPWNWDDLPYELSQDFNWLEKMKQNGFAELLASQSVSYRLESYDIAVPGSQMTYKGNSWYLASVRRYLLDGNLRHSYCLKQPEGLYAVPYFNQRMTGISIDGTVSATERDRVQVTMEIDAGSDGTNHYWFPFSTVASSSDGSGWYCMPEQGESVRVFFPVDDEKEGYVITSIKGHEPEAGNAADPMGNPAVRSIATQQNNQVQFTESGVVIAAGGENGSVLINKDGSVVLDGLLDITIAAAEAIQIMAGNELVLTSQTTIRLVSDAGSDIEVKSGEIGLHGMMIYENC